MNQQVIADNLIKFRKEKGLTQKELSLKINYSDKVISKWERGESLPDVIVLNDLAALYGVTLDELIIGVIAQKKEKEKIHLIKTKEPSVLVVALFIFLIFIWTVLAFLLPIDVFVWTSLLYIVLILLTGININHHEWETIILGHKVKVINKFLSAELLVDGKREDIRSSLAAIGVNLRTNIGSREVHVSIFRLMRFTCEIFVK